MALPKREYPYYTAHLELSNVDVKYRPYNNKEEQIINMAMMSDLDKDKIDAVYQIVENCVEYDLEKLLPAEVEYLYLKIVATSDSPKIPISVSIDPERIFNEEIKECNTEICPKEITGYFDINNDVYFDEFEFSKYAEKTKSGNWAVRLAENYSDVIIVMNIKPVKTLDEMEILYSLSHSIIDETEDGDDGITLISNITQEEYISWINDIPATATKPLLDFLEAMPGVKANVNVKCKKCGFEIKDTISGLVSFLI